MLTGRRALLEEMQQKPFDVRILLGGRRIGKTSTLKSVQWSLLDPNFNKTNRAFPVLINLQVEQPKDLENLRYILIARLRESIDRWQKIPMASLREMYRSFLRQIAGGEVAVNFLQQLNIKFNIVNPDNERRLIHDDFRQAFLQTVHELKQQKYSGVCFILDGAEFITGQDWANHAWSYFRGLKDTETTIKPFLGLLLSGYRELKEYQQAVGSQLLNIADIKWLHCLTDSETEAMIDCRAKREGISLTDKDILAVQEWAGCHPYLVQQMLNEIYDIYHNGEFPSIEILSESLLYEHDNEFSSWWNEEKISGSFSDVERLIYRALIDMEHRQGSIISLSKQTQLSPLNVKNALNILLCTGVVRSLGQGQYKIGARLFEEWVKRQ